jgi:hypothetical protein
MKANELRVGNWVELYGSLTVIHRTDFAICKCHHGIAVDKGNPITLTEDWFKKFGFELFGKDDPWDMYWTHKALVGSIDNVSRIYNLGRIQIKYVHQLQNLFFAMTGEELIINHNK